MTTPKAIFFEDDFEIEDVHLPDNFSTSAIVDHESTFGTAPTAAKIAIAYNGWKLRVASATNYLAMTPSGYKILEAVAATQRVVTLSTKRVNWPSSFNAPSYFDSTLVGEVGFAGIRFNSKDWQGGPSENAFQEQALAFARMIRELSRKLPNGDYVLRLARVHSVELAGRPVSYLDLSPLNSDYIHWASSPQWSVEQRWENYRTWLGLDNSTYGIGSDIIKSVSKNKNFGGDSGFGKFRRYLCSNLACSPFDGAQSAVVGSIQRIVEYGWVPIPFPIVLGHELLHACISTAPGLAAAIVWRALEYCVSKNVRKKIDGLFGYLPKDGKFSNELKKSQAKTEQLIVDTEAFMLANCSSLEDLTKYLSTLNARPATLTGTPAFGLLRAAHIIFEAAAVHGVAAVVEHDSIPAGLDPVSKSLWSISENSIRQELNYPKRPDYKFTLPGARWFLGLAGYDALAKATGATGGRYPWSPQGLAKLCGTEVSHPWFQ